MGNVKFVKTEDSSTGLYDNSVEDIYHSKSGALKEAFDKFINPAKFDSMGDKIRILDICYGIGYNTKAVLKHIQNKTVEIDCLDYNKELSLLSPFIVDGIEVPDIKLKLLAELLKSNSIEEIYNNLLKYYSKENLSYFSLDIVNLIKKMYNDGYKSIPQDDNLLFLHNIYYNYISSSMYKAKESNNNNNICLSFYFDDARTTLITLKKTYDVIFLDAFSPQKDPTLWTIDF